MAKNPVKSFIIIALITGIFLTAAYFLTSTKEVANHQHSALEKGISKEYLLSLPLKTPNDRIERLSYLEKDGVKDFQLSLDEIRWEYAKNKFVHAWAYNGQIPGPEIRVTEGDKIRVIVSKILEKELGEFELARELKPDETTGKLFVEIIDEIEEKVKAIRMVKAKK